MRASHTTKTKKAKCLNYRAGKRCGRVARHEVSYRDGIGQHHLAVCDECLAVLQEKHSVSVGESSRKGLIVIPGLFHAYREYRSIE